MLQAASSLALVAATSRVLGLAAVGELALAITGYAFIVVVESAVVAQATRSIYGQHTTRAAELLRRNLGRTLQVGALVGVGLGSLAAVDPRLAAVCLPAWAAGVVAVATAPAVASLQAAERFDRMALSTAAGSGWLLVTAYPAVGLAGVVGASATFAVATVLGRVVACLLASRPSRAQVARSSESPPPPAQGGLWSLIVLSATAQLGALTDVVLLRVLADSAEAGRYRLGAQVPTLIAALGFKAYDVVYPRLTAGAGRGLPDHLWKWTRGWGLAVGAALGLCAAYSDLIVRLLVGEADRRTTIVIVVFSVVWLANFAVHGLSLWLIAVDRQQVLVPVVVTEYLANLVLTVMLVPAFGAVGCAFATLSTLLVSNLIVVPLLLRHRVPESSVLVFRSSLAPAALAALAAGALGLVVRVGVAQL